MKDKEKHYRAWGIEVINCSDNLIYLNYLNKYFHEFGIFSGLTERTRGRLKKTLEHRIEKLNGKEQQKPYRISDFD